MYNNTFIEFFRAELYGVSCIMRNEEGTVVSNVNLPELDTASLQSLFTELEITTVQETEFSVVYAMAGEFIQREVLFTTFMGEMLQKDDFESMTTAILNTMQETITGTRIFVLASKFAF